VSAHRTVVVADIVEATRPKPRPVVYRNMSTPEARAFWEPSALAKDVDNWPAWKRAGINVVER
jgi:hypothetical protein